ncbi:chemotaxis protein CheR [Streptomyces solincola]|uniref:Chemotaxis protein CheR n=1 Tax=Streptomyces solincola TaxID=2100817 RepID=A0A2S9PQC3_9ACTN|nr:AMP-binding protein [Streptomyces solincola]PRH76619.1 chemotaxis protein CheR [Streptomyces solincola]
MSGAAGRGAPARPALPAPRPAAPRHDDGGGPATIHGAVARQARLRPGAVALIAGAERIGYAELDAAAEDWAAELRARGAGPGVFVPLLLPRSAELVTAALAVLKTGAAYAALDPAWPAGRLTTLAAALSPVVTVAAAPPEGWPGTLWTPPPPYGRPRGAAGGGAAAAPGAGSPDEARDMPRPDGPDGPDRARGLSGGAGDAPAAVFFTSGTTGRPKAVVSGHRATLSLFGGDGGPLAGGGGHGRTADGGGPLGGGDAVGGPPVMPLASPVSWDAFTLEVWGPLLAGGACVLTGGGYLLPGTLRALVAEHGVDTVWLTASLFHLLTDEDPDCFTGLRQVLTGGETLSPPRVRAFLTRHPDIALTNGYGPVETCVFATARRVRPGDCDLPSGIPVGAALPGRAVHVLDAEGRAAGPGAVGEVCVSGDGVALGYLGEPELTARQFPVIEVAGGPARVYRTGDLGFLDEAGVLHFAGRADRQVKVRGHRVEPAEVETAARALPGVADCAAAPVPGAGGGFERLALFYTTAPGAETPEPRGVRRALAGMLPRHLVPDLVHRRTALPLTANGKLDRAALLRSLRPGDGGEGDV